MIHVYQRRLFPLVVLSSLIEKEGDGAGQNLHTPKMIAQHPERVQLRSSGAA